jgi:hypothetical protein
MLLGFLPRGFSCLLPDLFLLMLLMLLSIRGSRSRGDHRLSGLGRMAWGRHLLVSADTTALKTGLTVGKLDSTKREVDNGRISFFYKVVLGEPFDV